MKLPDFSALNREAFFLDPLFGWNTPLLTALSILLYKLDKAICRYLQSISFLVKLIDIKYFFVNVLIVDLYILFLL